jgi:hypothetical protein
LRPSNPSLLAASRLLFDRRDVLVADWMKRLGDKASGTATIPAKLMQRDLRLMVDLMAEMAGPMRREGGELWTKACEHYGRTAAARGLAAGEVAEELSALRELLTRDLAASVAALRARRALAVLLHLNRVIDRGIAIAVAGYTDALVATLFMQDGVPSAGNDLDTADIEKQLGVLEQELTLLTATPPSGEM